MATLTNTASGSVHEQLLLLPLEKELIGQARQVLFDSYVLGVEQPVQAVALPLLINPFAHVWQRETGGILLNVPGEHG